MRLFKMLSGTALTLPLLILSNLGNFVQSHVHEKFPWAARSWSFIEPMKSDLSETINTSENVQSDITSEDSHNDHSSSDSSEPTSSQSGDIDNLISQYSDYTANQKRLESQISLEKQKLAQEAQEASKRLAQTLGKTTKKSLDKYKKSLEALSKMASVENVMKVLDGIKNSSSETDKSSSSTTLSRSQIAATLVSELLDQGRLNGREMERIRKKAATLSHSSHVDATSKAILQSISNRLSRGPSDFFNIFFNNNSFNDSPSTITIERLEPISSVSEVTDNDPIMAVVPQIATGGFLRHNKNHNINQNNNHESHDLLNDFFGNDAFSFPSMRLRNWDKMFSPDILGFGGNSFSSNMEAPDANSNSNESDNFLNDFKSLSDAASSSAAAGTAMSSSSSMMSQTGEKVSTLKGLLDNLGIDADATPKVVNKKDGKTVSKNSGAIGGKKSLMDALLAKNGGKATFRTKNGQIVKLDCKFENGSSETESSESAAETDSKESKESVTGRWTCSTQTSTGVAYKKIPHNHSNDKHELHSESDNDSSSETTVTYPSKTAENAPHVPHHAAAAGTNRESSDDGSDSDSLSDSESNSNSRAIHVAQEGAGNSLLRGEGENDNQKKKNHDGSFFKFKDWTFF